jgi:hypothetical protein
MFGEFRMFRGKRIPALCVKCVHPPRFDQNAEGQEKPEPHLGQAILLLEMFF